MQYKELLREFKGTEVEIKNQSLRASYLYKLKRPNLSLRSIAMFFLIFGLVKLLWKNRNSLYFVVRRWVPKEMRVPDLDTSVHSKVKIRFILEELHCQYTPFFIHYFHQITNLSLEYGDSHQSFQKSLLTKMQKMLLEKVQEIQEEVIEQKYNLPSPRIFRKLVEIHSL